MWCVGKLTEEYRERMYDLLDLYARPFRRSEPVVCLDEKSKQLLKHSRAPPCRLSQEFRSGWTMSTFVQVPVICSLRSNPRAVGGP